MASPPVKVEGLLGMLTFKLSKHNYTKWAFQFKSVLNGYKLFDDFDGIVECPAKFVLNAESRVTKEIINAFKE